MKQKIKIAKVVPRVTCLSHDYKNENFNFPAIAAKFCTNPDNLDYILEHTDQEKDNELLKRVIDYRHLSVFRFEWWVFAIENISRTCSHQLVRKTTGVCFAQESMRYTSQENEYKIIIPESIKQEHSVTINLNNETYTINFSQLANICFQFYKGLEDLGIPNEDARFALLEASKTKILMGINSQALLDLFAERCCTCAQWEIRMIANEMLKICKKYNPTIFKNAGPKCLNLGFCPESKHKWKQCKRTPRKIEDQSIEEQIEYHENKLKKLKGEI